MPPHWTSPSARFRLRLCARLLMVPRDTARDNVKDTLLICWRSLAFLETRLSPDAVLVGTVLTCFQGDVLGH